MLVQYNLRQHYVQNYRDQIFVLQFHVMLAVQIALVEQQRYQIVQLYNIILQDIQYVAVHFLILSHRLSNHKVLGLNKCW